MTLHKWAYRVERWRPDLDTTGGYPPGPEALAAILSEAGEKGWELVAVIPEGGSFLLVLKFDAGI